jgi:hypothetical protein
MRISEALGALLAALALAACDPAAMGGSGRTAVTVAGRSVVIAGPPGFCVDRRSSTMTSAGAFVLLSDCALLGASRPAGSAAPVGAALTASVSTGGLTGEGDDPAQSLEELAAFAATADGRAMLGRSGQPDRVRIHATRMRDGVLYVLVEDRGPQPIVGVDRLFWRAFLEVNGRMTALSVLGFEGAGVDAQTGLNHLAAFAEAIQAANASATARG